MTLLRSGRKERKRKDNDLITQAKRRKENAGKNQISLRFNGLCVNSEMIPAAQLERALYKIINAISVPVDKHWGCMG